MLSSRFFILFEKILHQVYTSILTLNGVVDQHAVARVDARSVAVRASKNFARKSVAH